jgi:hypothetical protein
LLAMPLVASACPSSGLDCSAQMKRNGCIEPAIAGGGCCKTATLADHSATESRSEWTFGQLSVPPTPVEPGCQVGLCQCRSDASSSPAPAPERRGQEDRSGPIGDIPVAWSTPHSAPLSAALPCRPAASPAGCPLYLSLSRLLI